MHGTSQLNHMQGAHVNQHVMKKTPGGSKETGSTFAMLGGVKGQGTCTCARNVTNVPSDAKYSVYDSACRV